MANRRDSTVDLPPQMARTVPPERKSLVEAGQAVLVACAAELKRRGRSR